MKTPAQGWGRILWSLYKVIYRLDPYINLYLLYQMLIFLQASCGGVLVLTRISDLVALKDNVISSGRLSSYRVVFSTATDEELLGAYLWNARLASEFYPLLSFIEVALRNSISSVITAKKGMWWWRKNRLRYKSFSQGAMSPKVVTSIYDSFSDAHRSVKRAKKDRYGLGGARIGHHEVIGATNFIVWEKLLDNEFMGDSLFWPAYLGEVFLGWPSNLTPSQFLISVRNRVKTVREFRNRLAHHEPLWKAHGVSDIGGALVYLNSKLATAIELLQIISPDKRRLIENSGLENRLRRVCSVEELLRHQEKARKYALTGSSRPERLMLLALERDRIIEVEGNGKVFLLSPF